MMFGSTCVKSSLLIYPHINENIKVDTSLFIYLKSIESLHVLIQFFIFVLK